MRTCRRTFPEGEKGSSLEAKPVHYGSTQLSANCWQVQLAEDSPRTHFPCAIFCKQFVHFHGIRTIMDAIPLTSLCARGNGLEKWRKNRTSQRIHMHVLAAMRIFRRQLNKYRCVTLANALNWRIVNGKVLWQPRDYRKRKPKRSEAPNKHQKDGESWLEKVMHKGCI